jgi:hypothetical protein
MSDLPSAPSRPLRAPNDFGATVTTKTDPIALFERVRAILAHADTPLGKLEECVRELQRVVASNEGDREEIASRRKIEMTAATPASELDKRLDTLDLPPGALPVGRGKERAAIRRGSCE